MITKIYFRYAPGKEWSDKAFHAVDGWKIEPEGMGYVRLTHTRSGVCPWNDCTKEIESHRAWGYSKIFDDSVDISLTDRDFMRLNLPKEFWPASLVNVPESIRPSIENYCHKLPTMVQDGLGFILAGSTPGVGKTGAATVMAKEARLRGISAFFVTISDLRELTRTRVNFEGDQGVLDRCREVSFLALDALRVEDAGESFFNAVALEALLETRAQWKRSTVITTRMTPEEFSKHFKGVLEVTRANNAWLSVKGENLRLKLNDATKNRLIVPAKK